MHLPTRLTRCAASLILPSLAACASDAPARTERGAAPAVERLISAYCERLLECPGGELAAYDHDTCLRAQSFILCTAPRRLPDVSECEQALRHMSCESIHREWWAQGCEPVLQAYYDSTITSLTTSLPGGLCADDFHCKAGMRCEGAEEQCAGRCVPAADEGEPCDSAFACRHELVCSRDGVCERPRAAGSLCRDFGECQQGCLRGVCVDTEELIGQPCVNEYLDCGDALRCSDGLCKRRVGPHGRCERSSDCYPGLSCFSRMCEQTVDCHEGERGEPCMDSAQCARDLTCNLAERRCADIPRRGDTCSLDLRCGAGDQCVGASKDQEGVCEAATAPAANGDPCSFYADCASGFCADGLCAKPVACDSRSERTLVQKLNLDR